jgi:hypothetical protein
MASSVSPVAVRTDNLARTYGSRDAPVHALRGV